MDPPPLKYGGKPGFLSRQAGDGLRHADPASPGYALPMIRRRWPTFRRNVVGAVLSLALLRRGSLALADEVSPPPAPPAVPAPVVYSPMGSTPADRPAGQTPTLPAPAKRPVPAVPPPAAPAQVNRPAPTVPPPAPPAPANRPAPIVYSPMGSTPANQPAPIVNPPPPSAPTNQPAPTVQTPMLFAPADRPAPIMYSPMGSAPADRPAPIVNPPPPSAPTDLPAPISVAAPPAPATYAPAAVLVGAHEDAAIAETVPLPATAPKSRHLLGLATDLGLPDGVNLGLVVRPASWIRLHAAGGTNTASVGFRGGATAIPHWFSYFGPSITLEAGYCRMGEVNGVLRTFFQVPPWMKDYAQEAGYAYYNAHLGLEFGRGNVTGFIHAGGSYVDGTVRMPNPVCVQTTGTPCSGVSPDQPQLILGQDAKVRVYTISAKAGLIVYFGGL